MNKPQERRRHIRHVGQDMVAVMANQALPLINLSIAGLGFQGGGLKVGLKVGDKVTVMLARMSDMADSIDATITVRSVSGTATHAEFHPTWALMRYLVAHIGEATGTVPTHFKPKVSA